MSHPPSGTTAHVDRFVRDHLPPPELWPDLLYDLPGLDYAPQTNVAAELVDRNVAEGRGGRVAVETDRESLTYEELREQSSRIAGVLVEELGLIPGGRVLLRAPNNPMMVACWMAVARAGGVVVATMPLLRSRELAVIADKARVDLALCDDRLMEEMNAALELSSRLERVVPFAELDRLAGSKSPDLEPVATAIDDPVLIAFTSGTTGAPKGCVHFHRDLLASADAFFRRTFSCDETDVFAGSPPLAFTFGLGMLAVFPFRVGARTALLERPSPEALVKLVADHRVSVLATAPTAYRAMLPLLDDYDTSSLRYCVSAGETLPRPTGDAWHEATGLRLVDGLGATELFHIFVTSVGEDVRPGATGKPVSGYEAKVFDDDMREVPSGTVGKLAVRGPTGCRYLDDPRQSDYVRDGWNFTGDAYRVDEDGYFWFEARADDMIISAGYNIAGPEVEQALLTHDAVADCACVAAPDEERGQIVKAYVVLKEDAEDDETMVAALQDHVKATIAPYKYPRAVEFLDNLPRTETGKVQRFRLRERARGESS